MTSRLDRLFVLLEAGAGPATRRAAARQLGEVQKAHPEELHRLLGRLMRYLQSPAWETRVAASHAVEAILANVPDWDPPPGPGLKDEDLDPEASVRLKCATFDIERVLKDGAHLTGSEGREYDMEEEALSATDSKERLSKQRQQLNQTLGLDVAAAIGLDVTVFSNEDLLANKMQARKEPEKRPVEELVTLPNSKPLSSREINLAKRKARQAALTKQKSRDCDETPPPDEPDRKKIKLEPEECYLDSGLPTPEPAGGWGGAATWPLERWCGTLQALLFSGAWEARHGAATALRALLRGPRAGGGGRAAGMTPLQMEEAHQDWLEDMALRLVCVLALDRFGDFVSDQVVAPVRETSAQALGAVLSRLSSSRALGVASALSELAAHDQWEARHGALLACKYLVAARQELAVESGALRHLLAGLGDAAEDVCAVAAGALVPAAAALAATLGVELKDVVSRLWRLLAEQDELAAPAHSYLALLAALMSITQAAELLHPIDLSDVLPRLWPYLDHSASSVRRATLQTLCTITKPLSLIVKQNSKEEKKDESNGIVEEFLDWSPELLQQALRHVFQRILFEHVHDIQDIAMEVWQNLTRHAPLGALLVAACPLLSAWMCAAMHSPRAPVDAALILLPPTKERRPKASLTGPEPPPPPELRPPQKWYLGGGENQPPATRERNVTRARVKAADAIGLLSCYLVQPAPGIEYKTEEESPIECYVKVLTVYLRSGSAMQRLVCALCTAAWARHAKEMALRSTHSTSETRHSIENSEASEVKCASNGSNDSSVQTSVASGSDVDSGGCARETEEGGVEEGCGKETGEGGESETVAPPSLAAALHAALCQPLYYDELAFSCNKILQEARDLLAMMKHYKLPVDGEEFNNILRLEQVIHMTTVTGPLVASMKSKRVAGTLEERRAGVQAAARQCCLDQAALHVAVQAALAGACAHLRCLPEKLNPVIRPLMESIKKESSLELQQESARSLAALLAQLESRDPCPNGKVLHNLKAFLRCDPEVTPRATLSVSSEEGRESGSDSGAESRAEGNEPELDQYFGILTLWEQQRAAERAAPRRGRPPALAAALADDAAAQPAQDEAQKALQIQRRGATLALTSLTQHCGAALPRRLPRLWDLVSEPLLAMPTDDDLENQDVETSEELISRLQVFETICPHLHPELYSQVVGGAGGGGGKEGGGGLRALAALTRHKRTAVRHMAARCLAAAVAKQPELTPILADELLPGLGDVRCARVRCGAAEALARAVAALQLHVVPYIALLVVPLLGRMSDPCLPVRVMSTRCFATLIQLMPLEGAVAEPANLTPDLRARREKDKLFLARLFRPQDISDYVVPVPVAATLRSYQQAGVNWLRFLNEYKLHGVLCDDMGLGKTLQCICVVAGSHHERQQRYRATGAADAAPLPSLVVCPPTLTGHWVFEVNKFVPSSSLRPLQYVGPPAERERLRAQLRCYTLIVASYDIVRKDIEYFSKLRWNYCILDEGHVIKNGKTKAFKAIKQIVANHRLILSGTPIQNNVLELWSLFDFLMPGLLGTERQFTAQYSRPILAARDARASPHQLQAGALACEALHRQVLPFLLRRVKEDVLKELPPKITQDYYCELSPLQKELYEDLSLPSGDDARHAHVFQALHYLQNVCNHPKLVLTGAHPAAARVARRLAGAGDLDDINHAAKLPALKQLLLDCGIGTDSSTDATSVVSQHRALIFCQLKKMLDIVENDLLKRHLPGVSYLRLDGSVPAAARHGVVSRFNTDPSIDVLLLTTQVGGLGLNLTGADTVIFVEHDWNPMKDLQAMDRAHRIGQRRVVNVYRLITRDTLEEKIMGLQKFKLQTANTVISSENAALETMGTDQLLDLVSQGRGEPGSAASGTNKSVLDSLPELWDQSQYEEEYDMGAFLEGLRKGKEGERPNVPAEREKVE